MVVVTEKDSGGEEKIVGWGAWCVMDLRPEKDNGDKNGAGLVMEGMFKLLFLNIGSYHDFATLFFSTASGAESGFSFTTFLSLSSLATQRHRR